MSGAVIYYGLILISLICIFLGVDYHAKISADDDVFNSTRTTQISTLSDSINIGDLRVNNKLSIDQNVALEKWISYFEQNSDMNLHYIIEIIDIHEDPGAIVVSVKGYRDYMLINQQLTVDYTNIIILDDGKEK